MYSVSTVMARLLTFHPDRYQCTWDSNLRLAAMAESSASKLSSRQLIGNLWRRRVLGHSGDLMETFTWAGAVAGVTRRIGIISTLHVTLIHPVFAAKAEATVDLISNGRAGMNLVLGWYPPDLQLFGGTERHDRPAGEEWMEIFDRLGQGRRVSIIAENIRRYQRSIQPATWRPAPPGAVERRPLSSRQRICSEVLRYRIRFCP